MSATCTTASGDSTETTTTSATTVTTTNTTTNTATTTNTSTEPVSVPTLTLKQLCQEHVGRTIEVTARIHLIRVAGKRLAFIILRQRGLTLQAVVTFKAVGSAGFAKLTSLPRETLLRWGGTVVAVTSATTTTHSLLELHVTTAVVMFTPTTKAALTVEECSIPQPLLDSQNEQLRILNHRQADIKTTLSTTEDESTKQRLNAELTALEQAKSEAVRYPEPARDTRLNHRSVELRTCANQAIFRLQSTVCHLFRQYLFIHGFTEIHTPKLLSGASEGGANVFELDYFGQSACLAQSPQFYKQMCVLADFERVYEIGPVFRAENSLTHRHLTEFVGLDVEMTLGSGGYDGFVSFVQQLLEFIFVSLTVWNSHDIDIVRAQFPGQPLQLGDTFVRITYAQAVAMLAEAGIEQGPFEDLTTANERALGQLVKTQYGTDVFVLDKFPAAVRPFYSLPATEKGYANAFDVIVRGQEICSGSQRQTCSQSMRTALAAKGVTVDTALTNYLEAFDQGAPAHAGCGLGLERLVMLFLGLGDIRQTSLFPRDPKRLTP